MFTFLFSHLQDGRASPIKAVLKTLKYYLTMRYIDQFLLVRRKVSDVWILLKKVI